MPFPGKTIGAFLKEEREKKGLNYDQICQVTRLRPPILKALEDELWEDLPSPVLVSGFVRSYGHALGLEEKKVMALFRESGPSNVSTPKPLVEPVRNVKSSLVMIIFLLLALVLGYFFWKGYPTFSGFLSNLVTNQFAEKKPVEPEKIQETLFEIPPVTQTKHISLDDQAPIPKPEPNPESNPEPDGNKQSHNVPEQEPPTKDLPVITGPDHAPRASELTLKASITETTWLRIFVDDQDPKEYIFRPQEHFEWKAKKGFELLIGNAGGIDFELNGTRIENQGTRGRVVTLTFPTGYERRHTQD